MYYLCTDLDRTLLPNGAQQHDKQAIQTLDELHKSDRLKLVYVSGRDKRLIKQAIQLHNLPVPDFAIADVGARIYRINGDKWEKDQQWKKYLSRQWDDDAFDSLGKMAAELPELTEQEPEKQSRFKHSFYLTADMLESDIDRRIIEISNQLKIKARIIKSLDETTNTGLLDILPAAASKYHAIRFLMDKYQISLKNTVFSGDSGNDMEVLVSEIPAILVRNAIPEIKQLALSLSREHGNENALYIAEGDFHQLNGYYCSGILEGLANYFPVFNQWIAELLKR